MVISMKMVFQTTQIQILITTEFMMLLKQALRLLIQTQMGCWISMIQHLLIQILIQFTILYLELQLLIQTVMELLMLSNLTQMVMDVLIRVKQDTQTAHSQLIEMEFWAMLLTLQIALEKLIAAQMATLFLWTLITMAFQIIERTNMMQVVLIHLCLLQKQLQ